MCGIVGYIGKKNAKDILIKGLKQLEYRGYDSSGIALFNNDLKIVKSIGRINNLEAKLAKGNLEQYNIGIAHTRWATHGGVTEGNAHPHHQGKVVLVHNGIIENAKELKKELINDGYKFLSETDTEVAAALIDKYYKKDALDAINQAMNKIIGSYAFGIIFTDKKDVIYTVKKDSPLVIGIGDNENFFASDICALSTYTDKFIYLDELEVAAISKKEVKIYKDKKEIKKESITITNKQLDVGKNGYDHYMLKEIYKEPVLLEKMFSKYLNNLDQLPDISKYKEIHVIACGSAYYAGMIFKSIIEEISDITIFIDVASEYRYKKHSYKEKTLVVAISQSGETADTVASLRIAKNKNTDILAIVNEEQSTIARESDMKVLIEAGKEIAVATTKAYLLQVAVLSLIAFKYATAKKIVDKEQLKKEYKEIPKLLNDLLNKTSLYKSLGNEISKYHDVFFIGRKIDYALCMEGSLKLKEISYIHSEAYQAGELKHGTISLIDDKTLVIAILTDEDIYLKTLSNLIEVSSRGAKTYTITTDKLKDDNSTVAVKNTSIFTESLLVVPTLQLISYYTALNKKCDIDKPKNLAKSVTVE